MVDDYLNAPGGDDDAGISPRFAHPLRAAERLDETFPARVMSAVHAEARAHRSAPGQRGWWRRTRTIQLSPLGALGMAAGIAALAASATLATERPSSSDGGAERVRTAAAAETVHVVRFVLNDRGAKSVSLVGDFNAWSKDATPLVEQTGNGTWVVSLALPSGRHEYAFVVRGADGERWTADPSALPVRDDFGTESSIVTVGASDAASARPSTS